MKPLLDDYIFSDSLRYEAHGLVYTSSDNEPVLIQGMLGAAILCALLVDTEEGDARGIAIDTDEQQQEFFRLYDRLVRRDGWGMLRPEMQLLRDAYVQLELSNATLSDLCPNIRLEDLAMQLTINYMQHLVVETYGAHIWECYPWRAPFAQWLWDAARIETRRQRFLHTDWTDPAIVSHMADMPDEGEVPTLFFEDEAAEDIMSRYFHWMWDTYQKQVHEMPGSKITAADKRYIIDQESDWLFLSDEIDVYDEEGRRAWLQWMSDWQTFLTRKLRPPKQIRFWVDDVPETLQEKLLDYLRLQEKQPAHYVALTSAVYALRQLGYISYKLTPRTMRQYLSDHLSLNYTLRTIASQFDRAWKEHGRYTDAVREQIDILADYGIKKF